MLNYDYFVQNYEHNVLNYDYFVQNYEHNVLNYDYFVLNYEIDVLNYEHNVLNYDHNVLSYNRMYCISPKFKLPNILYVTSNRIFLFTINALDK